MNETRIEGEDEREREAIAFLTRADRASGPIVAPRDFTDRVMARVALEPRASAAPARALWANTLPVTVTSDPLPWWVRALAQPVSALAFLVLGVAVAWREALVRAPAVLDAFVAPALHAAAPWGARLLAPFALALDVPGGTLALALAAIPLAALASYACYGAAMAFARSQGAAVAALARRTGP